MKLIKLNRDSATVELEYGDLSLIEMVLGELATTLADDDRPKGKTRW